MADVHGEDEFRLGRSRGGSGPRRRGPAHGRAAGEDWSGPDPLTTERMGRRRLVDHLQRIVVDVRGTVTADRVEPSLRALARARAVIDALMMRLIASARAQDTSWERLGDAIGLSGNDAADWYRDQARAAVASSTQRLAAQTRTEPPRD